LDVAVGKLSGGEKARVLIARLMLQPADLLLLDEPTNDLDIPTLEVLEDSLLEFPGALVLVSHDRYLLDRVATAVLGLDGQGGAGLYADYRQWQDRPAPVVAKVDAKPAAEAPARAATGKKKLSYIENREWEQIESLIHSAETELANRQREMESPEVIRDPQRLQQVYAAVEAAQANVDRLYERWGELEAKLQ
jgi:ATP-binding cassette subfamily F protein uup